MIGESVRKIVDPDPINILGVKLHPFESYEQVCSCIQQSMDLGSKISCVAINPEKIYSSQKDGSLKALLNGMKYGICDGIGSALAVRILYGKKIQRITGISLFFALIEAANVNEWNVFLLGASPESNEGAFKALKEKYPNINIVGHQHGFFDDTLSVIEEINRSNTDILFVAMGSPKQEFWIEKHKEILTPKLYMGVGGSFDVLSGNAKWAPSVFRKTGTEWLYRLISQPSRWRRQLVLPKFMYLVLKEKVVNSTRKCTTT